MAPQKPPVKKSSSKNAIFPKTISKKTPNKKTLPKVINSHTTTGFYFELPASELAFLPSSFTPFDRRLLSCITAALKTGIQLHGRLSGSESEQIDIKTKLGQRVDAYLVKASRNHVSNDKFMCLRLLGTSLNWIRSNMPILRNGTSHETAARILQLLFWRTFAIGDAVRLQAVRFSNYKSELQITEIADTIESWVEKKKLHIPAYGQMMIEKGIIREMVESQWKMAREISKQFDLANGNMVRFTEMYNKICEYQIPFMKRGCLIPWLVCADLSEYGICALPLPIDVSLFAGTSGPKKAIDRIATWTRTSVGDAESRRASLVKVMETISNPPAGMTKLRQVTEKCEKLQGRKLNLVDVEHSLCKIGRML